MGSAPSSDWLHIRVDDLDSAITTIRAAGGKIEPTDIHTDRERWGIFTDLDGNRLGIYQQRGTST